MTNEALSLTLRPKKTAAVWLLLVSSLFTGIGIWIGLTASWVGYLIAAFFGLGISVAIVQLLPGSTYLHLTQDGLTFVNVFCATAMQWGEFDQFFVCTTQYKGVPVRKMAAFNLVASDRRERLGWRISRALAGCDGALPDTYGMTAEALTDLLNSCLHEFTGRNEGEIVDAGNPR